MRYSFFLVLFFISAGIFGQQLPGVLICGHRGGFDGDLPENSISRWDHLAKQFGKTPFMIELDVRETSDSVLYILHDETLDRTTNGKGKISEAGSALVKQLKLKDKNGKLTAEKIPGWEKALGWLSKHPSAMFMVDIKGSIHEKVIRAIQRHHLEERCLLLTFSVRDAATAKAATKKSLISCLVGNEQNWKDIQELHIPVQQQVCYINDQTPPEVIGKIKEAGAKITTDVSETLKGHPSVFSKETYAQFLTEKKVDILITDFPKEVSGMMRGK